MEGIYNILKDAGIELTDEVKKKITKSLATEYKSISEYSNLKKKIEDLSSKLESKTNLESELEKLKGENSKVSKLYEEMKNSSYKYDTLKNGVNERFVDFVASDVLKNKREDEDFSEALTRYIGDNPQFLNNNYMSVSTAPKTEIISDVTSSNDMINKLIRGG